MTQSVFDNGGFIGVTKDFALNGEVQTGTETVHTAPTYVGGRVYSTTGTSATRTITFSLTGGIDTVASDGDLIIVSYSVGSTTQTNTTPSLNTTGYTELAQLAGDATYDVRLGIFYQIAVGTVSSVVINGPGNSTNAGAVAIQVWRNVDQTNPFDTTLTTAVGGYTGYVNPPAITTVTDNAVVVMVGANGSTNAPTTFTNTAGLDNFITITGNDNYDTAVFMGSTTSTTPQTVDFEELQYGSAISTQSWAGASIALKPALTEEVPVYITYSNSGIWSLSAVTESL